MGKAIGLQHLCILSCLCYMGYMLVSVDTFHVSGELMAPLGNCQRYMTPSVIAGNLRSAWNLDFLFLFSSKDWVVAQEIRLELFAPLPECLKGCWEFPVGWDGSSSGLEGSRGPPASVLHPAPQQTPLPFQTCARRKNSRSCCWS